MKVSGVVFVRAFCMFFLLLVQWTMSIARKVVRQEIPTHLTRHANKSLEIFGKGKGFAWPAGNWQDNIRIPMLWRICLNQWEKNSRHGRAQLLQLSIEMISRNLLKSFQMIPRNWNSYTIVYLPQSYEKEKEPENCRVKLVRMLKKSAFLQHLSK